MTAPKNAAIADELTAMRSALRTALQQRIALDVEAGLLPVSINAAATARFYASVVQGFSV